MQKKSAVTALVIAVALAASSNAPIAPAMAHGIAPAAATAWKTSLQPAPASGIAAKKVSLTKVTKNNLNLRAGKNTKTKALLVIPKNSAVTVSETSGTWSKTSYKGKTGWVASSYLKNAPASKKPAPKAPAKPSARKVTKNNLNLRAGKSAKTRSLVVIPKNTTVAVVQTSGTWTKTSYKGKTGWVASSYLKNAPAFKKPAPKPTTVSHRYTTGFTFLRKGASEKSASLGAYQRRAKVEYLAVSGAWTKVKASGKTGFIKSSDLSQTNPALVSRWLESAQVVHQGTSKNSPKVTSVAKGSKVEWLRTSGSWMAIRTPKGNGWVPGSALSKAQIKPTSSKPPASQAVYRWTTANVNLRKGAGTSHPSLGTIPANERVTYLKGASGWSNVKSSKGTGWVSDAYLNAQGQYPFAVYGTLRKGQSAYYILKGKTSKETKTTISSHSMYLQPKQTWLSYVIPSKKASDKVVVERMDIKPSSYLSTVANMDAWERFDPKKPLADQNYNRVLVTDKDGKRSWAYLGSKKIAAYLMKNGIRVTSGDYLKRF